MKPRHRRRPHAFTLLELLAVVAVVAVLIGILLPVLGRARHRAEVTVHLAWVRSAAVAITAYSQSNDDYFPYLATPERPLDGIGRIGGWGPKYGPRAYFASGGLWPSVVLDSPAEIPAGMGGSDCLYDSWRPLDPRETRPCRVMRTAAYLTHTTAARPEFWVREPLFPPDSYYNAMRLTDVRYPGAKGMLLDVSYPHVSRAAGHEPTDEEVFGAPLVALMDGSAGFRPLPPDRWTARTSEHAWVVWPIPVISTVGGVHGRDY